MDDLSLKIRPAGSQRAAAWYPSHAWSPPAPAGWSMLPQAGARGAHALLGFSGDGRLYLGNLGRIGVDPLQSRSLGNLGQVLQGQVVSLDFGQCGGFRCRWRCKDLHWCCCWRRYQHGCRVGGRRYGCYKFSSYWCPYLLGRCLIWLCIGGHGAAISGGLAALAVFATFATVTAIAVTAAAFAGLARLFTLVVALLIQDRRH